ncbi:beta/gamma crystallin-related protein [Phenylobacterium sp.]|uniref:beta/gamma crystallin-related protein n=1 Tax=Phenylobacterium sp. TaxID=1871053 RepID=UPI002FC9F5FC
MLRRILLTSILVLGASAPALAQDRMAPNAQLFQNPGYQGRSLTVLRDMPIIPASWTPRSIRVRGGSSWEVCEQRFFRGRCKVLTGDTPNVLQHFGLSGVGSIRQASGGAVPLPEPIPDPGQGGGGYGRSLKGMAAEFFPAPQSRGRRIDACDRQGGSAACVAREAETFCKAAGHVSAKNSAAETVGGRIYLADVLCSRWN